MLFKQPEYQFKLAVLLSGKGSTLENLLYHIYKNKLQANINLVISSRNNVAGLQIADNWNIPTKVIPFSKYKNDINVYSSLITKTIEKYSPNLIVLAGFLSKYLIPKMFYRKVINIHPSLIPEFSGKGFYGMHVHKAVKDAGVSKTGCTVHFVDNNYDTGSIIQQIEVEVLQKDTIDDIAKKVSKLEKKLYPQVIQSLILKHKYSQN